jgi:hypothetical protein
MLVLFRNRRWTLNELERYCQDENIIIDKKDVSIILPSIQEINGFDVYPPPRLPIDHPAMRSYAQHEYARMTQGLSRPVGDSDGWTLLDSDSRRDLRLVLTIGNILISGVCVFVMVWLLLKPILPSIEWRVLVAFASSLIVIVAEVVLVLRLISTTTFVTKAARSQKNKTE